MTRKNVVGVLPAALFVFCAADCRGPSDRLISIGSHRLEIHIEGRGAPAVVIDTGVTDLMASWRPLRQRISREVRVVTYNRAGYGRSEAGPLPRDGGREADELRTLLDEAGVPGPYVLVGHSLGALNVQVFASKYPGSAAGIVLLDPPPLSFIAGRAYEELRRTAEQVTSEWQAVADSAAESASAEEKARAVFFRMIASEHREMFGETARLADEIASFGGLPLLVMAAGKPNPVFGDIAEEYQKYWIEQNRLLARKSTKGRFVLAESASHNLYADAPDLVVECILGIVRLARAR